MTIARALPRSANAGNAANATATSTEEASGREALVNRYCELQPQLQRRFSAFVHDELREELHAITDHQLSVLTFLRGQSVTMRELAKELNVGESAATAVIDRLVRQGLVVRCDDPADRRVVRLTLSESAEPLVKELHEMACRKTASLLAALSDDQLAQLVAILETLGASAAANRAPADCKNAARNHSHEEPR
jgi:DNA-binding MarR family transcriptional regulator